MSRQTELSTGFEVAKVIAVGIVALFAICAVLIWIVAPKTPPSDVVHTPVPVPPPIPPSDWQPRRGNEQRGGGVRPVQPDSPQPVLPSQDIFEAAERGTVQDLERFIRSGADVNVPRTLGWTPLHLAAWLNPDVKVLEYLISQRANINASNNDGQTALDVANTEEKKRILREAMGVGVSVQTPRSDRNTENQQPRQTDIEARKELITKAIPIDMVLNATGFRGNNAMQDLANFGTPLLKTNFERTYDTWFRASTYDKDKTKATFESVRTNIKNFIQSEITPRAYFGNWPYQISNLVVDGSESSFTMTVGVGFHSEKFRNLAVEDTFIAFPSGVTATINEFDSQRIRIHVRGNTNVMREIDENKNNYNARVFFTNFRSNEVPIRRYVVNSTSAEVLGITIVRR